MVDESCSDLAVDRAGWPPIPAAVLSVWGSNRALSVDRVSAAPGSTISEFAERKILFTKTGRFICKAD